MGLIFYTGRIVGRIMLQVMRVLGSKKRHCICYVNVVAGSGGAVLHSIHSTVTFGSLVDGRAAGYSGSLHQGFCFGCFV